MFIEDINRISEFLKTLSQQPNKLFSKTMLGFESNAILRLHLPPLILASISFS